MKTEWWGENKKKKRKEKRKDLENISHLFFFLNKLWRDPKLNGKEFS